MGREGRPHIVFYKAKHFDKSRGVLRIRSGKAKVLKQIDEYRELFKRYRQDIEESYRRVCENLCALKGVQVPEHAAAAAREGISVEEDPRLVVFGFDRDQKSGSDWKGHEKALRRELGKRLILYGDPLRVRIPT